MDRLIIYKSGTEASTSNVRVQVPKWESSDTYMGEHFLSFTLECHHPIEWEAGDWCEFRGERFYLNYIPSCTQSARVGETGKAFTYEGVKMNTAADELNRCDFLDVIHTSGMHSDTEGTNYTGNNTFSLYCSSVTVGSKYYCPAHVLLDKIHANLLRLYGTTDGQPYNGSNAKWNFYIDDSKCDTDSYVLSVSGWNCAQALSELHNTFKKNDGSGKGLDFIIRGRNIIVGDVSDLISTYPQLAGLTGYLTDVDNDGVYYYYGYGKGFFDDGNSDGLFKITRTSNSEQQVITRLRAMGSTKNLPYRYYSAGYGLPQTMFVTNLQLPQTFLPYTGTASHKPASEPYDNKTQGNTARDEQYGVDPVTNIPYIRHVLGNTNDAYIEKNDDASSCVEGIREATARWDGSDGDLPEIYPTIKEGIYRDLRAAGVKDMDGKTSGSTSVHFKNYDNDERIDEILEPGTHCNYGDGIMASADMGIQTKEEGPAVASLKTLTSGNYNGGSVIFTTDKYFQGDCTLSWPNQKTYLRITFDLGNGLQYVGTSGVTTTAQITINPVLNVKAIPIDTSSSQSVVAKFVFEPFTFRAQSLSSTNYVEIGLPLSGNRDREYYLYQQHIDATWATPQEITGHWEDANNNLIDNIYIPVNSRIECGISISASGTPQQMVVTGHTVEPFKIKFDVNKRIEEGSSVQSQYIFGILGSDTYMDEPFKLILKDNGINWNSLDRSSEDKVEITMQSGRCGGMAFEVLIDEDINRVTRTHNGQTVNCWEIPCKRFADDSIGAYYPSENNPIEAGDLYIVTGILLPDFYIRLAETRLLVAATDYLLDNQETKFTYQPVLDELYLQRDYDRNMANNPATPQNSIFYRLYAGMKFPFRNIPENEAGTIMGYADITIEQVQIRMGEADVPRVTITLNDEVTESTQQKMKITVDRIYGALFGGTGIAGGVNLPTVNSLIRTEGGKLFLRKDTDDTASGNILFKKAVEVDGKTTHQGLTEHNARTEHNALAEFNQDFNVPFDSTGRVFGTMEFKTPVSSLEGSSDDSSDSSDEYEGIDGQLNGRISGNGNAQFTQLVVTDSMGSTPYATATDLNGVTEISEVYGEGVTGQSERFIDGFDGHGLGIWQDADHNWHITTDNLTVRQQMKVFELLIEKIRSTGGTIVVSCANGKIATAEKISNPNIWKLTFDKVNDFAIGDKIRCQSWNGLGVNVASYENTSWSGEVTSVVNNTTESYILAEIETGKTPKEGDEIVQWGSTTNTGRQNIIYITAAENSNPAINMWGGVHGANTGTLHVRVGKLDGINTGVTGFTPTGWGLYADNAFLKGELWVKTEGSNNDWNKVSHLFKVTSDTFQSVISGTRAKLIGDSIIHNQAFTIGDNCFDGWSFYGVTGSLVLSDGSDILSDGQHILSSSADTNKYVAVITEEDQLTHFVRIWDSVSSNPSIGIQQSVSVMRNVTFASGETDPKLVQFSFKYRIPNNQPAQIKILFTTQQGNIVGRVDSNNPTMGKIVFSNDGEWHDAVFYGTYAGRDANNINALTILAKGKIDITDICMMEASEVQELSTSIEQTDEKIELYATQTDATLNSLDSRITVNAGNITALSSKIVTDQQGNIVNISKAGLVTTDNSSEIITQYIEDEDNGVMTEAKMGVYVQKDENTGLIESTAKISADKLDFAGGTIKLHGENINLNGYTSINDGFTVDEDGTVTVQGVINCGILEINEENKDSYFSYTSGGGYTLRAEKCPAIVELNLYISEFKLPCICAAWDDNIGNYVIDGIRHSQMVVYRTLVGKKIHFYVRRNGDGEMTQSNMNVGIKGDLIVWKESPEFNAPVTFVDSIRTNDEPIIQEVDSNNGYVKKSIRDNQDTRLVNYPRTRYAYAQTQGRSIPVNTYVIAECKEGMWAGHECIYWELSYGGATIDVMEYDSDTEDWHWALDE